MFFFFVSVDKDVSPICPNSTGNSLGAVVSVGLWPGLFALLASQHQFASLHGDPVQVHNVKPESERYPAVLLTTGEWGDVMATDLIFLLDLSRMRN